MRYTERHGKKGRTLFEWALRIKTFWTTDKAFLHVSTRARGQKRDESATTKGTTATVVLRIGRQNVKAMAERPGSDAGGNLDQT